MNTIQSNLIEDIRHYKGLESSLEHLEGQIDKEARQLLKELQKIDGWQCMIKACKEHYAKCPNRFFDWCSVTYTDSAVQFVKGYSDGDEYEVMEIDLHNSLSMQVRNKQIELRGEALSEQQEIKEKELAELKRLKEKYENN